MNNINNINKLYRDYGIEFAEENAEGKAIFFDRNDNKDKELTRKVHSRKGEKYVTFFGIKWFFA